MLTALLLIALGQRQRAAIPTQPAIDWKIEITTDGGITGAGTGGMTVSSDGTLVITLINRKQCKYPLTSSEVQMIDAAVRNARPATWLECYSLADVNTHCCDLIRTTLSVTIGRSRYATSWLTGAPPFPPDLQSLADVLRGPAGIDARYRALCASAS